MTNTYEAFHTQDEENRGFLEDERRREQEQRLEHERSLELGARSITATLLTEERNEPYEHNGFGD